MKIALYSPYLDTYGGGERYILTIAEILSKNHSVKVLLDTNLQKKNVLELKDTLSKRLNLDLERVQFIPAPLGAGSSNIQRLKFLSKFDMLFALTDGSVFYSTAKKNILHTQTPLPVNPSKTLIGKAKLSSWNLVVYNSKFTQFHSQKNWPLKSKVIYPPVDVSEFKSLSKKKIILSVGRFFGYLKEKKHETLISAFSEIYQQIPGWELHLAGSAGEGDMEYIQLLKVLAGGAPVVIHPNLAFKDLVKLYGESQIYWHATGYNEEDPTKAEHFGITTVEAMASGNVPIVIKKGGQVEIVLEDVSGLFWSNTQELKEKTIKLLLSPEKLKQMSKKAIERSKDFSKEHFARKIFEIIND